MNMQENYDRKLAILSLSFKNRMKIAWQLTKPRLIPYFLFFLLFSIVAFIASFIPAFLGEQISSIFFILFVIPIALTAFISIGFYSSVLRFLEGKEKKIELATFFEPFHNWKTLLPALLVIGLIYLAIQIVFGLLSMIPALGFIISILGMIVTTILTTCYFFYLAEHQTASLGELLSKPINLILPHLARWMGAVGGAILSYLPAFILLVVFFMILFASGDNSTLDAIMSNNAYNDYYDNDYGTSAGTPVTTILGLVAVAVIMCLCGFAAYIFSSFLFAIAYKQSTIASELMPQFGAPNQFEPANQFGPSNNYAPFNQPPQPGQYGQPAQPAHPMQPDQPTQPEDPTPTQPGQQPNQPGSNGASGSNDPNNPPQFKA